MISPIDDTPASPGKAGIKPGDIIVDIDGHSTDGINLDDAVHKMRGAVGSNITLTLKRSGVDTPVVLTLTREIIQIQDVKDKLFPTPAGNIGYIRLASFDEKADEDIQQGGERPANSSPMVTSTLTSSICATIPGGLLDQAVAVGDDFLNSGEIVSTHGRHDEDDQVWYAQSGDILNGAPIVDHDQ